MQTHHGVAEPPLDSFRVLYDTLCSALTRDSEDTRSQVDNLWRLLNVSSRICSLLDKDSGASSALAGGSSKTVRENLTKNHKIIMDGEIEQSCNEEFANYVVSVSDVLEIHEQRAARLVGYAIERPAHQSSYTGASPLKSAVESWHDERDYLLESLILMITYFVPDEDLLARANAVAHKGERAMESVLESTTVGYVYRRIESLLTTVDSNGDYASKFVNHILDSMKILEKTIERTESIIKVKTTELKTALETKMNANNRNKICNAPAPQPVDLGKIQREIDDLKELISTYRIHNSRLLHQRSSLATIYFNICSRWGLSNKEITYLIDVISGYKSIDASRTMIISGYMLTLDVVFRKGIINIITLNSRENSGIQLSLPRSRFLFNKVDAWKQFYSLINGEDSSKKWDIPELQYVAITQLISLMQALKQECERNVLQSNRFSVTNPRNGISTIAEESESTNGSEVLETNEVFSDAVIRTIITQAPTSSKSWKNSIGNLPSTYLFITKYFIPTQNISSKKIILDNMNLIIPNLSIRSDPADLSGIPDTVRDSIINIFEQYVDNIVIYLQPELKEILLKDQASTIGKINDDNSNKNDKDNAAKKNSQSSGNNGSEFYKGYSDDLYDLDVAPANETFLRNYDFNTDSMPTYDSMNSNDFSKDNQQNQQNSKGLGLNSNIKSGDGKSSEQQLLDEENDKKKKEITSWVAFLYLITIVYMDRPDAALSYWKSVPTLDADSLISPYNMAQGQNQTIDYEESIEQIRNTFKNYYQFQTDRRILLLKFSSNVTTSRFLVPFLNVLGSISTGRLSSELAHARLIVDASEGQFGNIVWSVLFGSLSKTIEKVNNSNSDIPKSEEALIISFLRLLRQVTKFSFTARNNLTELKAIHVLFSFLVTSVSIGLKTAVIESITAFCVAPTLPQERASVHLDPHLAGSTTSKTGSSKLAAGTKSGKSVEQIQREQNIISRGVIIDKFGASTGAQSSGGAAKKQHQYTQEHLQRAYDIQNMVWMYLEECQLIPTKSNIKNNRFNQFYPGDILSNGMVATQTASPLNFGQPGVASVAGSNNNKGNNNDTKNTGILYDLLNVEAMERKYPQTKAFIKLLVTLTSVDRNPKTTMIFEGLGRGYRLPGIRCYIKYVIDEIFVKIDQFKFDLIEDKYELISYCMHLFRNCINLFDLRELSTAVIAKEKRARDTMQQQHIQLSQQEIEKDMLIEQQKIAKIAVNLVLEPGFEIITGVLNHNKFMTTLLSILNNGVDLLSIERSLETAKFENSSTVGNNNGGSAGNSSSQQIGGINKSSTIDSSTNVGSSKKEETLSRNSPTFIFRSETIRLSLHILMKIFSTQKVFLEVLCSTIVDLNAVEDFNLPTPMYGLDTVLAYNKESVISIVRYVSSMNDDISLHAVRLVSILSSCSPFSSVGSATVGLGMTRKFVTLLQATEDKTLLQGFVTRLSMEEDEYLPDSRIGQQSNNSSSDSNGNVDFSHSEKRTDALLLSENPVIAMTYTPQAGDVHLIRMAILRLIISNLSPVSSLMTIAHLILGFNLSDRLLNSTFGSCYDREGNLCANIGCLHIILDLLSKGMQDPQSSSGHKSGIVNHLGETMLQYSHPQLAELCYKVVYRLCENQFTSNQIMIYLRHSEDFFYIQAYNMPTFDMENSTHGEIRSQGDEPIHSEVILSNMKQRAWLLKLLTLELHMTASSRSTSAERLVTLLFSRNTLESLMSNGSTTASRKNRGLYSRNGTNSKKSTDDNGNTKVLSRPRSLTKSSGTRDDVGKKGLSFDMDIYDDGGYDDATYYSLDRNAVIDESDDENDDLINNSNSRYGISGNEQDLIFDEDEMINNELQNVLTYSSRKKSVHRSPVRHSPYSKTPSQRDMSTMDIDLGNARSFTSASTGRTRNRRRNEQSLSKILELLNSLELKEEDLDIDFNVRSDIFQKFNPNDFWTGESYDLYSVAVYLRQEIRNEPNLISTGKDERIRILETLLANNVYRELMSARRQCAVSWAHLVEVMITKCYDLVETDVAKERLLFDILIALVNKINANSVAPNRLQVNIAEDMSTAVFMIISKLQIEHKLKITKLMEQVKQDILNNTNNENSNLADKEHKINLIKVAQDKIITKPSSLIESDQVEVLNGLLTALESQTLSITARGNLYSSMIAFLRYTSPEEVNQEDGKFAKINTDDWLTTIMANHDTITNHLSNLLENLCKDAISGLGIWNIVPFTLLDQLYKLYQWHSFLNGTGTNTLLVALSETNSLDNFVRLLERVLSTASSEDLLSPDVDTQNVEILFSVVISFFLRVSITAKGAHSLLERNIIETISEYAEFLDHRPDVMRHAGVSMVCVERAEKLRGLYILSLESEDAQRELNQELAIIMSKCTEKQITFVENIIRNGAGGAPEYKGFLEMAKAGILSESSAYQPDVRREFEKFDRYHKLAMPVFRLLQLLSRQGPSVFDINSKMREFESRHQAVLVQIKEDGKGTHAVLDVESSLRDEAHIVTSISEAASRK